jgi:HSP20 family protein
MNARDPTLWMWGEALEMLERADRLQRQFCQLGATRAATPSWEPPVDVFETQGQFLVVVALPGVTAGQVQVELDGASIIVRGMRRLPPAASHGRIHRLELPYGRFERRIDLPATPLRLGERILADGCLALTLEKAGAPG